MLFAAALAVAACGPREARPHELRMMSENYLFTISPHVSPPPAREAILYKVVIRDKEIPAVVVKTPFYERRG